MTGKRMKAADTDSSEPELSDDLSDHELSNTLLRTAVLGLNPQWLNIIVTDRFIVLNKSRHASVHQAVIRGLTLTDRPLDLG